MLYAVDTPQQLKTIIRTLRQSRGLTQAQLGQMLGVSQKRIANNGAGLGARPQGWAALAAVFSAPSASATRP